MSNSPPEIALWAHDGGAATVEGAVTGGVTCGERVSRRFGDVLEFDEESGEPARVAVYIEDT